MIHHLKIQENYLRRLLSGLKKSEIRLNDRDYQLNDILKFDNPDREVGKPDFWYFFQITHIHSGIGLEPNYVVLSVAQTMEIN